MPGLGAAAGRGCHPEGVSTQRQQVLRLPQGDWELNNLWLMELSRHLQTRYAPRKISLSAYCTLAWPS